MMKILKKISLLVAIVILFSCSVNCSQKKEVESLTKDLGNVKNIKNVILLIGDGMGPNQIRAGELFKGEKLYMQGFPHKITVDTTSLTGVTDSAAAATALATGTLTVNGFVGKDLSGKDLETIVDIAKNKGKSTGVITTEELYGATPMSFSGHASSRSDTNTLIESTAKTSGVDLFASFTIDNSLQEVFTSNGYAKIEISGLRGGHSGVEIDKCRQSSNRLMARLLTHMGEEMDIRLCALSGGSLDNVIPSYTQAVIAYPAEKKDEAVAFFEKYREIYKNEFATAEPELSLTVSESGTADAVSAKDTKKLLTTLYILPYHVQEMSADIKGLVQTSLNLGVLRLLYDRLEFSFAVRSSVTTQKEELCRRVRTVVEYMGGEVSVHGDYPAWQYARVSPLRDTVLDCYKRLTGKAGAVMAIHAGLECGLFSEKLEDLDCISFGPDLRDVHSTAERLNIPSTKRMYELVCEIIKNL